MKPTVLHLAKWYPNNIEPLLGIFVRKQIISINHTYNNKVISTYETDDISEPIKRVVNNIDGVEEIVFYHKKGHFTKLKLYNRIWKEIQTSNARIIHAHIMGWTSTFAYLKNLLHKTPYFITEHWSGYHYGLFTSQNFLIKQLKKRSAFNAEKVFTVSQSLLDDMFSCGIKATYKVIGNVVDGEVLDKQKNATFSFIFVGDLEQSHKNVSGILKSFATLKEEINIRLDIVGAGKDQTQYKQLSTALNINDSVKFHGSIPNSEVYKLLAQAQVLVLNSNYETFSIICAEALQCGIPVISTRCGGPESFLSKETGILIDPKNDTQLIEALRSIHQNYASYKKEELQKVALQFSPTFIGEEICWEYANVLN